MSTALYPGRCVLFSDPDGIPKSFGPPDDPCCAAMVAAMTNDCDQHDDPFDCPDVLISYSPVFNEYGIILRDGGRSVVLISSCPWCGTRLPDSLRDRWFDALEAQGVEEPLFSDEIPKAYRSAAWWRDT